MNNNLIIKKVSSTLKDTRLAATKTYNLPSHYQSRNAPLDSFSSSAYHSDHQRPRRLVYPPIEDSPIRVSTLTFDQLLERALKKESDLHHQSILNVDEGDSAATKQVPKSIVPHTPGWFSEPSKRTGSVHSRKPQKPVLQQVVIREEEDIDFDQYKSSSIISNTQSHKQAVPSLK